MVNSTIKLALSESFQELGGKDWLIKLGKDDPKTYALLLARLIPAEVQAEVSGQITHNASEDIVRRLHEGRERVHRLKMAQQNDKVVDAEIIEND